MRIFTYGRRYVLLKTVFELLDWTGWTVTRFFKLFRIVLKSDLNQIGKPSNKLIKIIKTGDPIQYQDLVSQIQVKNK